MAHFGVLSYRGAGHLNPLLALSRRLISRGHRVTFFQHPELRERLLQRGVEFSPIEISRPPLVADGGAWTRVLGIGEIEARLRRIDLEIGSFLSEYPAAILAAGVDALLIGEISLAGPTVAEMLQLPYFIISTSIPHHLGWDDPLSFTPSGSFQDVLRKRWLEVSILRMKGPVRRSLDRYRKQLGLRSVRCIGKTFPELAHITQWPQCLEEQSHSVPANFFHTGPFVDPQGRASVEFPWERLDGRPLIYASLGTTRKGDSAIFHRIAEACSGLGVQLVITLGGRRDPAMFQGLPGDPLLVRNAPQLELLKRADIVITHAGPNTVLETLLEGKPMLAMPITLDQPAVALRLARAGVAEVLSTERRSTEEIRGALHKLLHESSYRNAALRLQLQMAPLDGAGRAVELIEAMLNRNPRKARSEAALDDLALTPA